MSARPNDLEVRLSNLEGQLRRWKLGAGVGALLGVAALGAGMSAPTALVCDTVTAERFRLVDSYGRERGLFDCYGRDETVLRLAQNGGKSQLVLSVNDDGSSLLTFADAEGRRRSSLAVGQDGVPELAFYAADGEVVRRSRGAAEGEEYLKNNSR